MASFPKLSLFERDFDPTPLLKSLFGEPDITEEEKRTTKTWKTPYGCSICDVGFGSMMWMYKYHDDLLFVTEANKQGMLTGNEVKRVLEVCQIDNKALYNVPESVKKLAKAVGGTITRQHMGFGQWRVYVEGKISAFCNPFGISTGYTSSADLFEVFFLGKEEDPREDQTVESIIKVAKKYGYVPTEEVCEL
mmetsp:Transcript_19762/g.27577  ORF Transcript_19762/g.27577 Transcript_19762/m.27577 type:complete len:192 (+) Transcript_19762:22-597(+)